MAEGAENQRLKVFGDSDYGKERYYSAIVLNEFYPLFIDYINFFKSEMIKFTYNGPISILRDADTVKDFLEPEEEEEKNSDEDERVGRDLMGVREAIGVDGGEGIATGGAEYSGDSDGADAPALLTELIILLRHLQTVDANEYVQGYYRKFLRVTDLGAMEGTLLDAADDVESVCNTMRTAVPNFDATRLMALIQQLSESLRKIPSKPQVTMTGALMDMERDDESVLSAEANRGENVDEAANLPAVLRLNRDRLAALFSLKRNWNITSKPTMVSFMSRLNNMCDRSYFVDLYPQLIETVVMPKRLWWANKALRQCFQRLGKIPGQTKHIPSFMRVCCYAARNAHPLCPEERPRLGYAAHALATEMMHTIERSTMGLICQLVEKRLALTCEANPLEGSLRRQRRRACINEGKPFLETIPGVESETWAESRIEGLIRCEVALLGIARTCHEMKDIYVHGERISPSESLDKVLTQYLTESVEDALFPEGRLMDPKMDPASIYNHFADASGANIQLEEDTPEDTSVLMERPSVALRRLNLLQAVLDPIFIEFGRDCTKEVQALLAKQFAAQEVPLVGQSINPSVEPGEGDMWAIAHWFRAIMRDMSKSNSGLVWSPSKGSFSRPKSFVQGERALFPIELYMNNEDLTALCRLIGVNGVRCIDTVIMSEVEFNLRVMKRYLEVNRNVLEELQEDEHFFAKETGIDGPLARLVNIGVGLVIRKQVYAALSNVQRTMVPQMANTIRAAVNTVNPWEWRVQANIEAAREMGDDEDEEIDGHEEHRRAALSLLTHTPLYAVAADVGVVPFEIDVNMSGIMSDVFCSEDEFNLVKLLPTAFALSVQNKRWEEAEYFKDLEAFRGNEHCAIVAIATLLSGTLDGAYAGLYHQTGSISREFSVQMCRAFIGPVALMLSFMTSQEREARYAGYPLRPMILLMELFAQYCPLVSESDLERVLPFAMRQSAREMIHMGITYGDDLKGR